LVADESREEREALKKLRAMEPAGKKSLFTRARTIKNPKKALEARRAIDSYLKENME
jgi:hypothetical protein